MIHQHLADSQSYWKKFPTTYGPEEREIKNTLDYETILARAKEKDIPSEKIIATKESKQNFLLLASVYKDVEVIQHKDISLTDSITDRIKPQEKQKHITLNIISCYKIMNSGYKI